jgi:hypothetical protein
MPLGSSSAAPVTIPGPSALRKTGSRESQDDLDFADAVRRAPLVAASFAILADCYKCSEKEYLSRVYARSRKSLRSIAYWPSLSVIDLGDRLSIRREMS